MSAVSDITARLDLAQVAGVLGTDQATASQAVEEALTSLVGTMDANVGDPATALSLTRALGDHAGAAPFDVDAVDTADGAKIIQHVYSADQIQSLSQGVGGDLVRTLLPILAPLVMNYLAGKLTDYLSQSAGSAAQQPAGVPSDQGGLGDLLGGILGGGSGADWATSWAASSAAPSGSRPPPPPRRRSRPRPVRARSASRLRDRPP
ncbi:MAG TPA: DUF937 domain-containing protein [Propioniciclava sp.]|uniref:DUF937 domain-containing protein n=1 Tax=Propioniciclava sp. TaxID=2038686 RepID=UPI002B7EDFFC|nr:DUF937 domain-containing protein [Propioniciclava sp.]HRL49438.1 DUF937 domain-containing protein [Propioniciclava sp.]HRL79248.1 DUF937 domain-containing protein [Propioniciclava sp.]